MDKKEILIDMLNSIENCGEFRDIVLILENENALSSNTIEELLNEIVRI
jgi:hypothetical protein